MKTQTIAAAAFLVAALLSGLAFAQANIQVSTVATPTLSATAPLSSGGSFLVGDSGTSSVTFSLSGLPGTRINPNVPITLTASSAISGPYQAEVTIPASSFSSYEAQDLGNIRFYQGTTELYSWCQSGCSSSSQSAVFWVALPNGLSAGTTTINADFLPTTTEYDGVYAGEAPQLSATYGQYDNGASVFSFYNNFKGTTLSSAWNLEQTAPGITATVSNSLTLTSASGYGFGDIYTTQTFAPGSTVEAQISSQSAANNFQTVAIGTGTGFTKTYETGAYGGLIYNNNFASPLAWFISYSGLENEPAASISSLNGVLGFTQTSATTQVITYNGAVVFAPTTYSIPVTAQPASIAITGQAGSPFSATVQWVRERAYSAAAPTATVGTVQDQTSTATAVAANLSNTDSGVTFSDCQAVGTAITCGTSLSGLTGQATTAYAWTTPGTEGYQSLPLTTNYQAGTCGLTISSGSQLDLFGGKTGTATVTNAGDLPLSGLSLSGTNWQDSAEGQQYAASYTQYSTDGGNTYTAISTTPAAIPVVTSLSFQATTPAGQTAGHYTSVLTLGTQC